MNGEKHITIVLLIIVVLVALISSYAWFSISENIGANIEIESGAPVAFTISNGQGGEGNSSFNDFTPYSGQRGYDASGNILTGEDAPYYVYQNISYKMTGAADVTMNIEMEGLVVIVGQLYTYTFEQTIINVFGIVNTLTAETELNYYVTSTAYASNANSKPTGSNPSPIYVVLNTSTNKVTHIIFEKSVVQTYMTYDYWKSAETAVTPTDTHTSAKGTGVHLTYGSGENDGVSQAGRYNYVCVQALFYGNDGTKNTPCIFADTKFQGSTFTIQFSAGGV